MAGLDDVARDAPHQRVRQPLQGTAYVLLVGGQDRRQGRQHLLQHPERRLAAAIERHGLVKGVDEVRADVRALDGRRGPDAPLFVGRLDIRERLREDRDEVRVEAVVRVRAAQARQEGRGVLHPRTRGRALK